MRRAHAWLGVFATLAACGFAPDLSRFPPCPDDGVCAPGSTCLAEARRCVPDCGEQCDGGGERLDAGVAAGADGGGDGGPRPLFLQPFPLLPAIETRPWSFTFEPSGGTIPYAFSLDGGVPGFTLEVGGTLATGAAPTPGVFPFQLLVRDDGSPRQVLTTDWSLEVRPLLRVASPPALLEGRPGQAYALVLSATGGTPPYAWSVDGGALPPGVSLAADGTLSGAPSSTGTFSFVAIAADAASPKQVAARALSLQVKALDTLLAIGTPAAADGRTGTAYSQPLKAFGGSPPYAWSLQSGAYPPGVTLADTGTLGRLGGTPTDAGTYTFTVRCSDGLTSQNQSLSIVVH